MAGLYVRRGERVAGPFSTDQLRAWVRDGKLVKTDELAKDLAGPWVAAGSTKLFTTASKALPIAAAQYTVPPVPRNAACPPEIPPAGSPAPFLVPRKALGFSTPLIIALSAIVAIVSLTYYVAQPQNLSQQAEAALEVSDKKSKTLKDDLADPNHPGVVFLDLLDELLGKSDRDTPRFWTELEDNDDVRVKFAIRENHTRQPIPQVVYDDMGRILIAAARSGLKYRSITLEGSFCYRTKLGHCEEVRVIVAKYGHYKIDQIDWRGFDTNNILAIKDDGPGWVTINYWPDK